jgi:hypothetical protein
MRTNRSSPTGRRGGQSLTQMTPKAAREQASATTGPRTKSHTTTQPTRSSSNAANAPRRLRWPWRARHAAYPIQGTMARRIAIHAKVDIPWLNAPDTSRIIAMRLTRPVTAPSAAARFLLGTPTPVRNACELQTSALRKQLPITWSSQHRHTSLVGCVYAAATREHSSVG